MRTLLTGPFPWMIGGSALFILIVGIYGFFWLAGSAIVVDETGGVESAVITNSGGTEQKLTRWWNGYFYTIPEMEGTIEVRCFNGKREQRGYVTGKMHTRVEVTGKKPCEHIEEAA